MSSITVKILAFWLFYIPVAFSTEIGDVFNVKQGSENGGCDSHLSVLTRWWTESQAMASAGISAFDDAKVCPKEGWIRAASRLCPNRGRGVTTTLDMLLYNFAFLVLTDPGWGIEIQATVGLFFLVVAEEMILLLSGRC
jgi:hypothetical protein